MKNEIGTKVDYSIESLIENAIYVLKDGHKDYDNIDDEYQDSSLSFTPNDCSSLWNKIYEVFEDIDEESDILEGCSPDDFITESRLLTLDDCRDYEHFIKGKLKDWSVEYPTEVQDIFDSFKDTMDDTINTDIISLIRDTKYRNMLQPLNVVDEMTPAKETHTHN